MVAVAKVKPTQRPSAAILPSFVEWAGIHGDCVDDGKRPLELAFERIRCFKAVVSVRAILQRDINRGEPDELVTGDDDPRGTDINAVDCRMGR